MGRFIRANWLGLGFAAATAPLVLLLVLQVVWLTDLDRASALAHRAALRNGLEAVATKASHFYRSTAERLLNVPSTFFNGGRLSRIAWYWRNRCSDGVRRLFALDYTRSPTGRLLVFDPHLGAMVPTSPSDEALAIGLAAWPWQGGVKPSLPSEEAFTLYVNEQDPRNRIIFKPVVDDHSKIVGLVGLVVDTDYARNELFPEIIGSASEVCFGYHGPPPPLFVRDRHRQMVVGEAQPLHVYPLQVTVNPTFILRDWTIGAVSHGPSTDWMRGTLKYNLALGFALSLALMAGVTLTMLGARDAVRLSQMKSDFVSNVSHELRTPIASIRLFAEMLSRGRDLPPDKIEMYGTYMEVESRRLSRLVENILEFSRIESDQKKYRFREESVVRVIESVLESLVVQASDRNITLVRDVPLSSGPTVSMDVDAIEQALRNLLDNALKYSGTSDSVIVRMRMAFGFVIVDVEDQGIGIAPEDQGKIFERFHRVGDGLVHNVKGSGLGLAIVEHIVRAHGGRITLESDLGRGSTFSLWLPHRAAAAVS